MPDPRQKGQGRYSIYSRIIFERRPGLYGLPSQQQLLITYRRELTEEVPILPYASVVCHGNPLPPRKKKRKYTSLLLNIIRSRTTKKDVENTRTGSPRHDTILSPGFGQRTTGGIWRKLMRRNRGGVSVMITPSSCFKQLCLKHGTSILCDACKQKNAMSQPP